MLATGVYSQAEIERYYARGGPSQTAPNADDIVNGLFSNVLSGVSSTGSNHNTGGHGSPADNPPAAAHQEKPASAQAGTATSAEMPPATAVAAISSGTLAALIETLSAGDNATTPVTAAAALQSPLSTAAVSLPPALAAASGPEGATSTAAAAPQTDPLPPREKPCIAELCEATGCSFHTAADVLYGTIGGNEDRRDWAAIMASSDPLAAARTATGAMYNDVANLPAPTPESTEGIYAQTGNFAFREGNPVLIDGRGNFLTSAGYPAHLAQLARNYGFDTADLPKLAAKLDSLGIEWRVGNWVGGLAATVS